MWESGLTSLSHPCGLYCKSFTVVIYDRNDCPIIIYDRNDSGLYYKTIILAYFSLN